MRTHKKLILSTEQDLIMTLSAIKDIQSGAFNLKCLISGLQRQTNEKITFCLV